MGICCLALERLFRNSSTGSWGSMFRASLSSVFLAAIAEIIQPWFHRTGDFGDFMWGVTGIAAASLWIGGSIIRLPLWRTIMRAVAVVLLMYSPLSWFTRVLMAKHAADRLFPELMDLQTGNGGFFWSLDSASTSERNAQDASMLLTRTRQKPASAHLDACNRDWSSFDRLEIDATLQASDKVELGLRLDLKSKTGPRLRAGGWIAPGRQQIQIEWPQSTGCTDVHQLVLFLAAGEPEASLLIHRLRLIPRKAPSSR